MKCLKTRCFIISSIKVDLILKVSFGAVITADLDPAMVLLVSDYPIMLIHFALFGIWVDTSICLDKDLIVIRSLVFVLILILIMRRVITKDFFFSSVLKYLLDGEIFKRIGRRVIVHFTADTHALF